MKIVKMKKMRWKVRLTEGKLLQFRKFPFDHQMRSLVHCSIENRNLLSMILFIYLFFLLGNFVNKK